ncbi:hypothetical protein C8R46DRAFT_1041254 [Mycena filopes]|nr:hypothetical protein C8R46DRAFT_1041254 [Mycena filopes]
MSDPFTMPRKTILACKACRSRKQKVYLTLMPFSYVHTEKQKAALGRVKPSGDNKSQAGGYAPLPSSSSSSSPQTPYPASYGQYPSYGAGYAHSNSPSAPRPHYPPSLPPMPGANAYSGGSNSNNFAPGYHPANNAYPAYHPTNPVPHTQDYPAPGMYPTPTTHPPPHAQQGYPASSNAGYGYQAPASNPSFSSTAERQREGKRQHIEKRVPPVAGDNVEGVEYGFKVEGTLGRHYNKQDYRSAVI